MPNKIWDGQVRYCLLSTALVCDAAVERGIITRQNITPVLFFFISAGQDELIRPWLMSDDGKLREGRWLQLVGWLTEQYVLLEGRKNRIAAFLLDMGAYATDASLHSLQVVMRRGLPADVERRLESCHTAWMRGNSF